MAAMTQTTLTKSIEPDHSVLVSLVDCVTTIDYNLKRHSLALIAFTDLYCISYPDTSKTSVKIWKAICALDYNVSQFLVRYSRGTVVNYNMLNRNSLSKTLTKYQVIRKVKSMYNIQLSFDTVAQHLDVLFRAGLLIRAKPVIRKHNCIETHTPSGYQVPIRELCRALTCNRFDPEPKAE